MHNEVLTIAGPYIKTTEEGRALIAHSYTERLDLWRLVCTPSKLHSV